MSALDHLYGRIHRDRIAYDAAHELSYGYWRCPDCGAEFYDGGRALHERTCAQTDYSACIYVFGPNDTRLKPETKAALIPA